MEALTMNDSLKTKTHNLSLDISYGHAEQG